MPSFGTRSTERLDTCAIELQMLFKAIVKRRDCTVLSGHRGKEEQNKLFDSGNSKVRFPDSKHNTSPSRAIDISPYPIPDAWGDLTHADEIDRDLDWKERVKFYEFAAIVRYEAAKQGLKIRCGCDWDGDGDYTDQTFDDLVHFELVE